MPHLTAAEELANLRAEHERLTHLVVEYGDRLEQIDGIRKRLSLLFTAAWSRRNGIERRIMLLERKVTYCRPVGERKPTQPANDVGKLIATLTPDQLKALQALLIANKED